MEGFGEFNSSRQEKATDDQQQAPAADTTSDSDDTNSSGSSRRTYNRYTRHQLQELEKYFRLNNHPNKKQKLELGTRLDITPDKVKYWFQNRRTQAKARSKRYENRYLKQENDILMRQNSEMIQVLKNSILCGKCGVNGIAIPADDDTFVNQKRESFMGNLDLRHEVIRAAQVLEQVTLFNPSSSTDHSVIPITETLSQVGINTPTVQTNAYLELASSAMDELIKLGVADAPLWYNNMDTGGEALAIGEYARVFPPLLGIKPLGFVSDATRATCMVSMTSLALVEALLDPKQWEEMFLGIVGSSTVLDEISSGIGGSKNGAMQLMRAEVQLVSPFVPVRLMKFIRYAKQHAEGIWAVVDFSVDADDTYLPRRCPSGCIIFDVPNGFTQVTWIEHVEYNDRLVPLQYRRLISSGVGFGAQRWISALLRHCEGIRVANNLIHHLSLHKRRNLRALARRMTSLFCNGVCLTGERLWSPVVSEQGKPRIMALKGTSGLGQSPQMIMTITHSVWIPERHQNLFDLLMRKDTRCFWDVMCHRLAVMTHTHFPLDHDQTSPNCISVLYSNEEPREEKSLMLVQETSSDMTGSLIVYASVDATTVDAILDGYDSSTTMLLPIGLCIVPVPVPVPAGGDLYENGSMITVGFQIMLPDLKADYSRDIINIGNDLVSKTVNGIQEMVRACCQQ